MDPRAGDGISTKLFVKAHCWTEGGSALFILATDSYGFDQKEQQKKTRSFLAKLKIVL